ncbi:hypothetical protein AVEN_182790-1 [Araneus ventricosus]|uniref:Uncharacterized protein n=1 Tax=Araneus ventricosus TaxID=182803 RepID=A0A4Y2WRN8_ARAVE|nr:hypothetical protein AVEN_182790-1 [Araneus ventricosus]
MNTAPSENMGTVVNNIYFKSNKNVNELVIRAGQKEFNERNVIISNAEKNKKIPHLNPFLVQVIVKQAVNRHENIDNMKYTRQGWLVVWGLMVQQPFLDKLRQSNVKNQHSGSKNFKIQ